jgi:hypothetical protein
VGGWSSSTLGLVDGVVEKSSYGGGFQLASEAHVGAELEATAWSATLTQMHLSWVAHTSREERAGGSGGELLSRRPAW